MAFRCTSCSVVTIGSRAFSPRLGQPDARLSPHSLYRALGRDDKGRQVAYRALFRAQLDRTVLDDIRLASTKASRSVMRGFTQRSRRLRGHGEKRSRGAGRVWIRDLAVPAPAGRTSLAFGIISNNRASAPRPLLTCYKIIFLGSVHFQTIYRHGQKAKTYQNVRFALCVTDGLQQFTRRRRRETPVPYRIRIGRSPGRKHRTKAKSFAMQGVQHWIATRDSRPIAWSGGSRGRRIASQSPRVSSYIRLVHLTPSIRSDRPRRGRFRPCARASRGRRVPPIFFGSADRSRFE